MAYRTATTTNTAQIVALRHLSADTLALCEALRREAGRCWTDMITAHVAARAQGAWLTEVDLNMLTKGWSQHLFPRPPWFLRAHCGAPDHVSARLCRSAQDMGQEFISCCCAAISRQKPMA